MYSGTPIFIRDILSAERRNVAARKADKANMMLAISAITDEFSRRALAHNVIGRSEEYRVTMVARPSFG